MGLVDQIFGGALSSAERNEVAPSSVTPDNPVLPTLPADKVGEQTRPMCSLARYVRNQFRVNVDHRRSTGPDGVSVEMRLHDALMAQTCKYSAEERARMIAAKVNPRVFVPITSTKVRAAKAMLNDLIQSGGEPLFSMSATPDPEVPLEVELEALQSIQDELGHIFAQLQNAGVQQVPPEIMAKLQQLVRMAMLGKYDTIANAKDSYARTRAKRMERKVWDLMVQGGFQTEVFPEYMDYICTYGTCVVVGPIIRNEAKNHCIEEKDKSGKPTGIRKYKRIVKRIPKFEALNPFDCYPSPDAKKVTDGALCVRVKYAANELWRYADGTSENPDGLPKEITEGWNEQAVNRLLYRFPNGGVKIADDQRNQDVRGAEGNAMENVDDCTFEGIRCFASIRGSMLVEMGITQKRDGEKIKLNSFYYTETIVIDNEVVYCTIYDDRLGVPLSKGVFYELPGSWWGECIADKLIMVQYTMNVAIKALLQNMAVASGPMYWMRDVSKLNDKSPEGLKLYPHKIWGFNTSMAGDSGVPMGVLQVPSNASELLAVFEKMKTQADDDSGIPAYTYGQSSGQGALRTASGLAIFSEAASRGMKMVITTTDRLVIADVARRMADWVMIYDSDMDIKGDVEVKPVGLMGKILKAQQDQQRLTVFQMVITNQFLIQAIGIKGIFELFRPTIQDLNINPDNVVPTEERMRMMEMLQNIQQIFEATATANAAQENMNPQQGGGTPGVEKPEAVRSGVAERQAAA